MIKAIFWDNDGILVDTEHLYFQATRETMATAGVALSDEDHVEFFLRQGTGAWHLAEARGLSADAIVQLRDERNALYSRLLRAEARPIAGVADVLEALRGKYVMGIVTSSRKDHFDVIHETSGLLKYFDFVLTSGDFPRVKPHPDPYLMAIERSGVAPDECIAIEDSERGLEAATLAGIRCLAIPTALTRGCRFEGALRILADVSEVPAALGVLD